MWPDRRLLECLADKPDMERLECARAWSSNNSADERSAGLTILSTTDRDEALQSLLKALDDADKRVRTTAFVNLLWHNPPPDHGERIVAHLGGELGQRNDGFKTLGGPELSAPSD
jgi:HEAT repeat protein